MLPDRAVGEPFDDARRDIDGIGKEERRQQGHAADRNGRQDVPRHHRDDGDENLQREELDARHDQAPPVACVRLTAYGFLNVPMMPVEPLTWPSSAFDISSRVMPGWQRLRVEIGRDQHEGVVVRRCRAACTGRSRCGRPIGALAADIFVGWLADLAFGEAGHRDRDAVGDPVADAGGRAAFRIGHQQHVALGARRRIGPGQRRRDVLADAVRIRLVVAGVLGRPAAAVLERGRGDGEHAWRVRALAAQRQRDAGREQRVLRSVRNANMTFPLDVWLIVIGLLVSLCYQSSVSARSRLGNVSDLLSLRSARSPSSPRPSAICQMSR